jgi:hypothetical protein
MVHKLMHYSGLKEVRIGPCTHGPFDSQAVLNLQQNKRVRFALLAIGSNILYRGFGG